MHSLLTPPRKRGFEILDDRSVDPTVLTRSMQDVVLANRVFGGARAAMLELDLALAGLKSRSGHHHRRATLLDVGSGAADLALLARRRAARAGIELTVCTCDMALPLLRAHSAGVDHAVACDALDLPFADDSFDIVFCSQVLHHFRSVDAITLLREMNRTARTRVVISDLRRSRIAAAGLWLGSFLLRFHPVSRHDGVVSVMRGFLPDELAELVREAVGTKPVVNPRLGFRVTTSWEPA